ncbi:MAG: T9SS type A sorting domain-containing protein [Saprospiraceae bacterium]|nr:T9SS type A sorting domain-containing protein [Saprospiraceae bacterium]
MHSPSSSPDATSPGGVIDLQEATPFVLSGDMNLVGWQQQYTTLTTGDIVNTTSFGNGGPLDWDGSNLLDVLALQSDQRMAYTWHEAGSQYPPSRLDFHICSNSVLEVKKAFSLQSEIMSQARLDAFGLYQNDTGSASDHLPKVTDFVVKPLTGAAVVESPAMQLSISPNPAKEVMTITWLNPTALTNTTFRLFNSTGQAVRQWELSLGQQEQVFPLAGLADGIYFWNVKSEEKQLGSGELTIIK